MPKQTEELSREYKGRTIRLNPTTLRFEIAGEGVEESVSLDSLAEAEAYIDNIERRAINEIRKQFEPIRLIDEMGVEHVLKGLHIRTLRPLLEPPLNYPSALYVATPEVRQRIQELLDWRQKVQAITQELEAALIRFPDRDSSLSYVEQLLMLTSSVQKAVQEAQTLKTTRYMSTKQQRATRHFPHKPFAFYSFVISLLREEETFRTPLTIPFGADICKRKDTNIAGSGRRTASVPPPIPSPKPRSIFSTLALAAWPNPRGTTTRSPSRISFPNASFTTQTSSGKASLYSLYIKNKPG